MEKFVPMMSWIISQPKQEEKKIKNLSFIKLMLICTPHSWSIGSKHVKLYSYNCMCILIMFIIWKNYGDTLRNVVCSIVLFCIMWNVRSCKIIYQYFLITCSLRLLLSHGMLTYMNLAFACIIIIDFMNFCTYTKKRKKPLYLVYYYLEYQ